MIEGGLLAGRPAIQLHDPHISCGDDLFHLLHFRIVVDDHHVGIKGGVLLFGYDISLKGDLVLFLVSFDGVGGDLNGRARTRKPEPLCRAGLRLLLLRFSGCEQESEKEKDYKKSDPLDWFHPFLPPFHWVFAWLRTLKVLASISTSIPFPVR